MSGLGSCMYVATGEYQCSKKVTVAGGKEAFYSGGGDSSKKASRDTVESFYDEGIKKKGSNAAVEAFYQSAKKAETELEAFFNGSSMMQWQK